MSEENLADLAEEKLSLEDLPEVKGTEKIANSITDLIGGTPIVRINKVS